MCGRDCERGQRLLCAGRKRKRGMSKRELRGVEQGWDGIGQDSITAAARIMNTK